MAARTGIINQKRVHWKKGGDLILGIIEDDDPRISEAVVTLSLSLVFGIISAALGTKNISISELSNRDWENILNKFPPLDDYLKLIKNPQLSRN
ncbi:MAG: hypothetical protein PHF44_03220 [Candidatus Pacebacteria bacterium]|nr:hypothetical protein [Candidatus Paceibacterota bacterium]